MFKRKTTFPLLAADVDHSQKAAEAEAAHVAGRLAAYRLAEDRANVMDRAKAAIARAKRKGR